MYDLARGTLPPNAIVIVAISWFGLLARDYPPKYQLAGERIQEGFLDIVYII